MTTSKIKILKLNICLFIGINAFANAGQEENQLHYLKIWEENTNTPFNNTFEHLLNRIFIDKIFRLPEFATSIGLFDPLGLHEHNRIFSDISWEGYKKNADSIKTYRILLQEFPPEKLTEDEKLTKEVVLWQLDQFIETEKFFFHDYPVRQIQGITQNLFILLSQTHPIQSIEDKNAFLERLLCIENYFNQLIEKMTSQREKGIFPPRFAIEKALESIVRLNSLPCEEHPYYVRLINVDENLKKQILQAITLSVYPAYLKLQKFLEDYIIDLDQDNGVWALPDGDAYYKHMLKASTTLDITPEEIHQIGLREVARIDEEIRNILNKIGINTKNTPTGKLLQIFNDNENSCFPNNDEGRDLCIKKFDEILSRSRETLGPFFPLKPAYRVEIVPMSPSEEVGGPMAYYRRPGKNGRPGAFVINLSNMNNLPKFSMETLAIHEGEPGHHFQRAIEVDLDIHPLRKYYYNPAYAEGWALYAEKFAYEQGFFSTPSDVIGHLQDELWRAARLVVDTGIHWKRWSKSQAVEYMNQVVGKPYLQMIAEVERYFVLPGQACSYKIGQLQILQLRREAMNSMKDQFDIRKFHEHIIKNGALPLSLFSPNLNLVLPH